ncbi:MAG: signal peptidase II [Halanaerobiales bacterium]
MVSIITVLVFIIDRVVKLYILNNFELYESRPFIVEIVSLTFVKNTVAAFSILQGKRAFFIIMTIIMLALIVYLYREVLEKSIYTKISVGLIIGGALGNFYDRFVYHYVVDFIDFHFFPVFNIADSALVVGTIILSIIIWNSDKKSNTNLS